MMALSQLIPSYISYYHVLAHFCIFESYFLSDVEQITLISTNEINERVNEYSFITLHILHIYCKSTFSADQNDSTKASINDTEAQSEGKESKDFEPPRTLGRLHIANAGMVSCKH